jgi:hypothetical protein
MRTEMMKRSKKFFGQVSRIGVCAVAFFSVMMYLPLRRRKSVPTPRPMWKPHKRPPRLPAPRTGRPVGHWHGAG